MNVRTMNFRGVVATLVALSMGSSGIAFAQGNSGRNDRDDRGRNGEQQGGRQMPRGNEGRGPEQGRGQGDPRINERGNDRGYDRGHAGPRGAGPNHAYYRGDRMPPAYRSPRYVVNDWQGRHLRAPPRGYHWVQTGGDYVLVAIATGVILELLLNN